MLAGVKKLFRQFEGSLEFDGGLDETRVAAAALLVETALLDGQFDASERKAIRSALVRGFGISESEAAEVIAEGERRTEISGQIYTFTRALKDHLAPEDRLKIIEMLWEVIYADGKVDAYESNLVRRVAGLLFVPDRDSGLARQRVKARLGIEDGDSDGSR